MSTAVELLTGLFCIGLLVLILVLEDAVHQLEHRVLRLERFPQAQTNGPRAGQRYTVTPGRRPGTQYRTYEDGTIVVIPIFKREAPDA